MDASCLMITTNAPNRLSLLDDNIMSIERTNNNFLSQKVLSIDLFPEHSVDLRSFKKYEELGWDLVSGKCTGHRGMLNNILRGLGRLSPTDYIFYVEDDILIDRLPAKGTIKHLGSENIGFVCFGARIMVLKGPSAPEVIPDNKKQFINNTKNYKRFGKDLFLIKREFLRDNYYLNFPAAIVKDDVFRLLMNHSAKHCAGVGMEIGLTNTWFELNLDKKYDVAIYVRPDTLEHLPITLQEFYQMANMQYWHNNKSFRHPSINDRKNTIF